MTKVLSLVAAGLLVAAATFQGSPSKSAGVRVYDVEPNHLWNRIHDCFRVRTAADGSKHGVDTLDPLLWRETKHLLTEPSHSRAAALLDEFLASNGEQLIADPLKRAVFQHDLWAVFDWLATGSDGDKGARSTLMPRLARVIRRTALARKEIEALPDTYAAAAQQISSLPRDLFASNGPWVSIGGTEPVARQHAAELGRSAFIVFWNVPGGRDKTTSYLNRLWSFSEPFVKDQTFGNDGELRVTLNRTLPPVPDGTRLALVRVMLLIDDRGIVVSTTIVESVQLRVLSGRHSFSEIRMWRGELFAGKAGGLRPVGTEDREFLTFSSHGIDPFEREGFRGLANMPPVLDGCRTCHRADFRPPIETVNSIRAVLRPNALVDTRHDRWARWFTQPIVAAGAKSRSYEFGVLEGLWQSEPR
jgi:hypothetical protein